VVGWKIKFGGYTIFRNIFPNTISFLVSSRATLQLRKDHVVFVVGTGQLEEWPGQWAGEATGQEPNGTQPTGSPSPDPWPGEGFGIGIGQRSSHGTPVHRPVQHVCGRGPVPHVGGLSEEPHPHKSPSPFQFHSDSQSRWCPLIPEWCYNDIMSFDLKFSGSSSGYGSGSWRSGAAHSLVNTIRDVKFNHMAICVVSLPNCRCIPYTRHVHVPWAAELYTLYNIHIYIYILIYTSKYIFTYIAMGYISSAKSYRAKLPYSNYQNPDTKPTD